MKKSILFLSVFYLLLIFGCQQTADIEAEKAEILRILNEDDQELLDGVIKVDSADTSTSINIMQGELRHMKAADAAAKNNELLSRGKFVRIENLEGPIIGVSPDGRMAWAAVKTRFTIAYTDSLGESKEWQGTEARLEVYEKKHGKWESMATAQTY
jgi:hypothetical protein